MEDMETIIEMIRVGDGAVACVCTQMQTYTHTLYQSLWEVLLFSSGSLTDTLAQGELSERRPLSGSARRDMQGRFRHLIQGLGAFESRFHWGPGRFQRIKLLRILGMTMSCNADKNDALFALHLT